MVCEDLMERGMATRSFPGQIILKPHGHRMHFLLKKVDDLFCSRCPQGRQRRWLFHCQNETNKAARYGNILIFCSHYYRSKAKSSSQVIWPGAPWCSAATGVRQDAMVQNRL